MDFLKILFIIIIFIYRNLGYCSRTI